MPSLATLFRLRGASSNRRCHPADRRTLGANSCNDGGVADALEVAVVIPALDEEGAIGSVVSGFVGLDAVGEVVVVDNGSRDATAARARAAGATVVGAPARGYGRACQQGLAYLAERAGGAPDVVVFADGDGANDPDDLRRLLAPISSGEADLVLGSRVRLGSRDGLTPPQRFGNRLAVALMGLLFGIEATDLGPFRAIRWSSLRRLGMSDPDYGWTLQMQLRAAKAQLRVLEVDVHNHRRLAGRSKVSGTVRGVVGAGTKILGMMWTERAW